MRRNKYSWILFVPAAAIACSGCSKRSSEPAAALPAPVPAADIGEQVQNGSHGSRKLKGLDLPVYVDGVQKGVLRYGELPTIENVGTEFAPKFRLAEYLTAIGVSPDAVKSVYFFDVTNRIASIEGAELRKDKDRFVVRFASGTTGSAETGWDTVGLKNTFIVHEIRKMAVFAGKDVPPVDKTRHCVLSASHPGTCSSDVPYAVAEPAKGTRVYVDGKLAGVVKRRQVGDSLVVGRADDGTDKLSFARLVQSLRVDTKGAVAVEMVAGDEVVGRADAILWARHEDDISFTLPPHQHGKVRVHLPSAMQSKESSVLDRDALVTSVHVYKTTTPSARELVPVSESTDLSVQLASNDDLAPEKTP